MDARLAVRCLEHYVNDDRSMSTLEFTTIPAIVLFSYRISFKDILRVFIESFDLY